MLSFRQISIKNKNQLEAEDKKLKILITFTETMKIWKLETAKKT